MPEKSKPNLIKNFQNSKTNLEKNRKIYRYYRKKENKMKSENITEIMSRLTKSNILNNIENESRYSNINHIKYKNKKTDMINSNIINNKKIKSSSSKNNLLDYKKTYRQLKNNKDNSELILNESYNAFNDAKILCEYNSTNDRSLNTKNNESNKNKNIITANMNRNKKIYKYNNNNGCGNNKLNNNILKDNDGFITYEFDIDTEQNNQINGVKINNFDVKKPKEENLKFTFMKDEKESEISISHASKVIIGNIDGYKDIIETDIKNNANTHSKFFSNLINNKNNIFNNTIKKNSVTGENHQKDVKTKISNLSTLLKKESGGITFNDYNFYDSLNMTNNLDNISSTITNNIINENKIGKININYNNMKNKNCNIGKNEDLNNASFVENINKSIDGLSKIVNNSTIKSNNFDNNTNNKKLINTNKYNNKYLNNQYKNNEIEKKDNVNINCKIF